MSQLYSVYLDLFDKLEVEEILESLTNIVLIYLPEFAQISDKLCLDLMSKFFFLLEKENENSAQQILRMIN